MTSDPGPARVGHGFVWPEKADHYVLVDDVWTAECDEMLAAIRRIRRKM